MRKIVTAIRNLIWPNAPEKLRSKHPRSIQVVAAPCELPPPGNAKRVATVFHGNPAKQIIDYETDQKY